MTDELDVSHEHAEMLEEFFAEAEESLEKSYTLMDELAPNSDTQQDTINEVFRYVHSIKGLALFFDLETFAGLLHRLEFHLDERRAGPPLDASEINNIQDVLQVVIKMAENRGASTGEEQNVVVANATARWTAPHDASPPGDEFTPQSTAQQSKENPHPTIAALSNRVLRDKGLEKPLYLLSSCWGARGSLTDEDMRLIGHLGQVCDRLDNRSNLASFAEEIAFVLRPHSLFGHVSRVCLSLRFGQGNGVRIASVYDDLRGNSHISKSNYYCYVSPSSSILKLRPNMVRIYNDVEDVIESYQHQNRTPQRTLATLAKNGYRSGLCYALSNGHHVAGWLFMNSTQPELFSKMRDGHYVVLNSIMMAARIALMQVVGVQIQHPTSSGSTSNSAEDIFQAIRNCVENQQLEIDFTLNEHPDHERMGQLLLDVTWFAQLAADILANIHRWRSGVAVSVHFTREKANWIHAHFTYSGISEIPDILHDLLDQYTHSAGIAIEFSENGFALSAPADAHFTDDPDNDIGPYSIASRPFLKKPSRSQLS